MRRSILLIWVALLGLSLCAPAAYPRPSDTTLQKGQKAKEPDKAPEQDVTGTIVNRDNEGLADAKVTFSGPKRDMVRTDESGSFRFKGPPGDYVLIVVVGDESHTFEATIDAKKGLDPKEFVFPK